MSSNQQPWILGISASHNGSACLLKGDEIVVAVQEERLSRFKRHRLRGADPSLAVAYCLSYACIEPRDLSMVVMCLQGRKGDRDQNILLNPFLNLVAEQIPTITIPHHYGHALSVFATSGFEDAAILVVDGAGSPVSDLLSEECEVINCPADDAWEIISLYSAAGTSIVPLEKHVVAQGGWLRFKESGMPEFGSLGGMFSAVAQQVFGEATEAGKVMGLAPYGTPDMPAGDFFDIDECGFQFKDIVPAKFTGDERYPARQAEYENLASSVQAALEEALLYLAGRLRHQCASENLCYAGGVALNSVANERIIRECGFKTVHIMPAADDSGPAIGAAYHGLWTLTNTNTRTRIVRDAFGRPYSPDAISSAIAAVKGLSVSRPPDLIAAVVDLLCEGKIVGWFEGGSELGPRALGQRSIICDPRRPDAKEVLNRQVKMREPFRPFAPVVLLEEVENWFELGGASPASPFMLRVCPFKADRASAVPAVVHVDQTGRLQTVTKEVNGRFYDLVSTFYERTGIPIILNTSFNVMGEPIVETPADALACLLNTGLDCCVFEDRIVFKT